MNQLLRGSLAIKGDKGDTGEIGTPIPYEGTFEELKNSNVDKNYNYIILDIKDAEHVGHWVYYDRKMSEWKDGGVYLVSKMPNDSITQPIAKFFVLNKNGNLLEKERFKQLGYIYLHTGSKHNCDGYIYKLTKEFLDTDNITYRLDPTCYITFWNENDEFISGKGYSSLEEQAWAILNDVIPESYSYMIISIFSNKMNCPVLTADFTCPHGQKPTYYLTRDNLIDGSQIKNNSFNGSKIEDNSIRILKLENGNINRKGNLIEKSKIIKKGYFYLKDGSKLNSSHGYIEFTKEFLDLENNSYVFDFDSHITFWDENDNYISGSAKTSLIGVNWDSLSKHLPANNNFHHLRMSILNDAEDYAVFCKSQYAVHGLKTTYEVNTLSIYDEMVLRALTSNLNNKKGIFFGDSWCAGNSAYGDGWCKYLHEKINTFETKNCGRHGADWSQGYNYWFGNEDNYNTINNDYDYVIIEAYTNGLYGTVDSLTKQLGTIDEFTYYDSLETMQGALGNTHAFDLERFIYTIVNKWHGKKIGLMFPYKSVDMMQENNAFRVFREQVLKCCRKYNIPVLDNFDSCNIPTFTQEQISTYFLENDIVHLNENGYQIIGNKILKWLETL